MTAELNCFYIKLHYRYPIAYYYNIIHYDVLYTL